MKCVSTLFFPTLMLVGMLVSAFVIVTALRAGFEPAAARAAPPVASVEQQNDLAAEGRALFVAKGCIVCHQHDELAAARRSMADFDFDDVPNLTKLKMEEGYLRKWLRDPKAVKSLTWMPNLNLSDSEIDALVAFLTISSSAQACPVTAQPAALFMPPAPYPETAPYGDFWYGTEKLWTALRPYGEWHGLPHSARGYSQKIFWWRQGYVGEQEPQPALRVTGRRLDGEGMFVADRATNASHPDFGGWAMLTGVDVPTEGCWEITGEYNGAKITFVVDVRP